MSQLVTARCVIAGGGPAGMMLGLLLARAGVDVVVLEKHADFLRDFRGDTVHPSTLEVMGELGLLEAFLARPHTKVRTAAARIGGEVIEMADFTRLPVRCGFTALMPQWEFLNFIAEEAARYPHFRLMMRTEATGLLEEGGRVVGLRANSPDGAREIRADLVIGADGRHSTLRAAGGFTVDELGSAIDVLWLRLSRQPGDPENLLGNIQAGRVFVMLDRGDYWQCALVIPKGGFDAVRAGGLEALHGAVAEVAPVVADRVSAIASWDDVRLLTVTVNRVRRWFRPGLLLIGDAAHAMSPIGGIGINLAIQDAVATANILAGPLRRPGAIGIDLLRKVQRRRKWPTRATQRLQIIAQNRIIGHVLSATGPQRVPKVARLLQRFPYLRRYPARLVGLGVRPEHVRIASEQSR